MDRRVNSAPRTVIQFARKKQILIILFGSVFAVLRRMSPEIGKLTRKQDSRKLTEGEAGSLNALRNRRMKALLVWRGTAAMALLSSAFLRFGS